MDKIELNKEINLENTKDNEQKAFLDTTIGKIVDAGLDFAISNFVPDLLEKPVTNIKDKILSMDANKEKDEISKEALKRTKEINKSDNGEIDIINKIIQLRDFFKEEKTINSFSKIIDEVIKQLVQNDKISNSASKIVKEGKNAIIEKIKDNINHEFDKQMVYVEELKNQINKWKDYYKEKDISNMKKISKKVDTILKEVMPIENILKEAYQIQNIQKLLENNNNNFDLSDTKIELAKMLV